MVPKKAKILVAPLNWGLGHATRCIPIIRYLLSQDFEVVLASDGVAFALLRKEFPDLKAHEIPGYKVSYHTGNMIVNLVWQLPRIIRTVRKEHAWLKAFAKANKIEGIISDNRFGLYHTDIPSVVISHQINIPIPGWLLYTIGNRVNHWFLQKYGQIWVPDNKDQNNLSGHMSHHTRIDHKLSYLGILSRMNNKVLPKKYDVIIVLSGPEPQRTNLEHILLRQLASLPYKCLMVRGLPDIEQRAVCSDKLEMVSFLTSEKLNEVIAQSDLVISRSGYTTVLDLAFLRKKALFIPTPGQTEQEYLAQNLKDKGVFHSNSQDKLQLSEDIPAALKLRGFENSDLNTSQFEKVVDHWLVNAGLMLTTKSSDPEDIAKAKVSSTESKRMN